MLHALTQRTSWRLPWRLTIGGGAGGGGTGDSSEGGGAGGSSGGGASAGSTSGGSRVGSGGASSAAPRSLAVPELVSASSGRIRTNSSLGVAEKADRMRALAGLCARSGAADAAAALMLLAFELTPAEQRDPSVAAAAHRAAAAAALSLGGAADGSGEVAEPTLSVAGPTSSFDPSHANARAPIGAAMAARFARRAPSQGPAGATDGEVGSQQPAQEAAQEVRQQPAQQPAHEAGQAGPEAAPAFDRSSEVLEVCAQLLTTGLVPPWPAVVVELARSASEATLRGLGELMRADASMQQPFEAGAKCLVWIERLRGFRPCTLTAVLADGTYDVELSTPITKQVRTDRHGEGDGRWGGGGRSGKGSGGGGKGGGGGTGGGGGGDCGGGKGGGRGKVDGKGGRGKGSGSERRGERRSHRDAADAAAEQLEQMSLAQPPTPQSATPQTATPQSVTPQPATPQQPSPGLTTDLPGCSDGDVTSTAAALPARSLSTASNASSSSASSDRSEGRRGKGGGGASSGGPGRGSSETHAVKPERLLIESKGGAGALLRAASAAGEVRRAVLSGLRSPPRSLLIHSSHSQPTQGRSSLAFL